MTSRPSFSLFLILAPLFCLGAETQVADRTNADWKLTTSSKDLTIYSRPHPGSSLKEFKATGEIEAPARAVHQLIDDIDAYASFMPYVTECRLLKRDGDSVITYQRISPKVCSDRDYALRIRETSWATPGGLAYSNRWEPANEFAPAKKTGVVRINLCQGAWLLEPDGADKTRATYSIYTDTGGFIPAFIANHFSQSAIGKVFDAVRKQVKNPKYNQP